MSGFLKNIISSKRSLVLIAGILIFCLISFLPALQTGNSGVNFTMAITAVMALLWITEALPLAVTSLLPVVLFPLTGVLDGKDVSAQYFNHVIFLFIGGFMVALAMQKWNLHKRIALRILMLVGVSPFRLMFGFMLATAFLSMWISNTATAMMMIPILMSVLQKLEENQETSTSNLFAKGLLLSIAYSASIGGIATLTGSPPNLMFAKMLNVLYPAAPEISFAQWMMFAAPVSVILFFIALFFLYFLFRPKGNSSQGLDRKALQEQYSQLGKISFEEKSILILFSSLAFLWVSRSDIAIGNILIPGWSKLLPESKFVNDGTVAILVALLLFVIPSKNKGGKALMSWADTKDLPWGIVLLFGGGFALAYGFVESGVSGWLEIKLGGLAGISPLLIIIIVCTLMTFLTEVTSNTATTGMMLPILAGLAGSISKNPLLFMLPATLSASMAFMLPVATPPNAIIFGTGKIAVKDMAKTGLWLNLIGVIVISLCTYYLGRLVFGIDMANLPLWVTGQ